MPIASLLLDRLHAAGLSDVTAVEPVEGGQAALAGVAARRGGSPLFVKSFVDVPAAEAFWERFAHALARLHTSTTHHRFGWERDNWLGRYRQENAWTTDGYEFFARRRLLRWLPERRVRAALDHRDRQALERLCERLPDLLPPRPACLTHGDLWAQNILATEDGRPAVIDPAVSYTWAEVDLAQLWCTPHPQEAKRFFDVYAELTGLDDEWRARMPLIQLRQHLAVIAQFDHDWGAAQQVRAVLQPFRR